MNLTRLDDTPARFGYISLGIGRTYHITIHGREHLRSYTLGRVYIKERLGFRVGNREARLIPTENEVGRGQGKKLRLPSST